jgi:hypothetical protein
VPRVHTLLSLLDQPTPTIQQLRSLLSEQDRFPTWRTWKRRLAAIPATLPAQIACLGRCLVTLLQRVPQTPRAERTTSPSRSRPTT